MARGTTANLNLRLKHNRDSGALMWVDSYGLENVYINLTRKTWLGMHKKPERIAAMLSHEILHIALERFSHKASVELDNLFQESGDHGWERFPHGLGNLDDTWEIIQKMRKHYYEVMKL